MFGEKKKSANTKYVKQDENVAGKLKMKNNKIPKDKKRKILSNVNRNIKENFVIKQGKLYVT